MYYMLNLLNKFSHETRPIGILFWFLMMDVYCLQSEPTPWAHPIFGKVRLPPCHHAKVKEKTLSFEPIGPTLRSTKVPTKNRWGG